MMKMMKVIRNSSCLSLKQRYYSGLLTGINSISEIKDAQFYTQCLDIKETSAFLNLKSYVYEQAMKDVKLLNYPNIDDYFTSIKLHKTQWMKKDLFHDRKLVVTSIKELFSERGQFECLLGGSSTGKTVLFNQLSQEKNDAKNLSIIHLNMRRFGDADILKALLTYLEQTKTEKAFQVIIQSVFSFIPSLMGHLNDEVVFRFAKIIQDSRGADMSTEQIESFRVFKTASLLHLLKTHRINEAEVIRDILVRLSTMFESITLVIDEADFAFTPFFNDQARIEKSYQTLQILTGLSKQSQKINIILSSSDYSFHHHLHKVVGFKTGNFTSISYMGEVSPSAMFQLLTEEWKYGDHLAIAMIEHLGGHIWDHSNGINQLALYKERYHPSFHYDMNYSSAVMTCMEDNFLRGLMKEGLINTTNESKMISYLRTMAKNGFVPVLHEPYEDRVCQVITQNDIGGVVKHTGIVVGVPDSVWYTKGNKKYGLVPAKQSIRLIIAEQLTSDHVD